VPAGTCNLKIKAKSYMMENVTIAVCGINFNEKAKDNMNSHKNYCWSHFSVTSKLTAIPHLIF